MHFLHSGLIAGLGVEDIFFFENLRSSWEENEQQSTLISTETFNYDSSA